MKTTASIAEVPGRYRIAVHYADFDIRANFSSYDLDPASGTYRVIREGHLDQPAP